MIYKKHELSLSLNGDQIMHIARNAVGVVVFRKESEKALKKAIDDYIKEQQYQEELAEQKRLEKESKQNLSSGDNKKVKQEEVVEESVVEDNVEIKESNEVLTEQILVPQKRVTRGPDGKFISKSQLDLEEVDKKKSFWDKLTS